MKILNGYRLIVNHYQRIDIQISQSDGYISDSGYTIIHYTLFDVLITGHGMLTKCGTITHIILNTTSVGSGRVGGAMALPII